MVLGLAAGLAGALVVSAALRPADLTLAGLGPWCACGAALALGLAGSAMIRGTGLKGHVVGDMAPATGPSEHVPTRWSTAALAVVAAVAIARPNLVLARVDQAGEAWVRASALQRCLALVDPRVVPVLLPPVLPTRCESPLAGLRAGWRARRRGGCAVSEALVPSGRQAGERLGPSCCESLRAGLASEVIRARVPSGRPARGAAVLRIAARGGEGVRGE
ncbi:hypothetical protein [Nannocystis pusilla]|uniref:hypothetical protein n=1 Tax=Nannocystis pusilla TaxID=889268 RepID=UPI003B82266B